MTDAADKAANAAISRPAFRDVSPVFDGLSDGFGTDGSDGKKMKPECKEVFEKYIDKTTKKAFLRQL